MKRYLGERTPEGVRVTVIDSDHLDGSPLPMRLDLHNHSPTGFEYGYSGSGPAQLALALLADALGDDQKAVRLYQDFKFKVIARLTGDRWELSQEVIRETVDRLESDRRRRLG